MAAQDGHQQWIRNYTFVLEAYGLNYQVREYNDLAVLLPEQPKILIRNTASVVPQRIHMLGTTGLKLSAEESAQRLQAAEFSAKLIDEITRVRGRALADHHGDIHIELICVAGEPGLVPTVAQLQEQLPQLFTLMQETRQKLT